MNATPSGAPAPQQPWLHDLQVAVQGNSTVLGSDDASMGLPGTGWFVDDRRLLVGLDVLLDGEPASPVAAGSRGSSSEFIGAARQLGDAGADPTVEVRRTRSTVGAQAPERSSSLTEQVTITSRAASEVSAVIEIRLVPDATDIADVKAGYAGPQPPEVTDGADPGWSDDWHRAHVSVHSPDVGLACRRADGHDEARSSTLTWAGRLSLAPGASTTITVTVRAERRARSSFESGSGASACDFGSVGVVADDGRLASLVATSIEDLTGLLQSDPADPDDVFAAAGSPWYLTLFGRDALWTARMMAPFSPALSMGTLRALARRQGERDDVDRAEQPGKMLHEVRRNLPEGGGLALPTTYFGSVDATCLWILLLHDAWRWGARPGDLRELVPHLTAALGWMRRAVADSPDGFLRYADESGRGLSNQGWKDSADSMRRRDGSIAPAPIALVEAQGYAVQAAHAAADLVRRGGFADDAGIDADRWEEWADELAARVHERFWVRDRERPYLAMALDGAGRPVDGLGSNMGHVLAGTLLGETQRDDVVAHLTGPDMLGPFGIGTLSRANPAYNPIGYHTGSVWVHDTAIALLGLARHGYDEEISSVAQALVRLGTSVGGRWPELCGGDALLGRPVPYPAACRPQAWAAAAGGALITALLGLDADLPGRVLRVSPTAHQPFGHLEVRGVKVAGVPVDIEVRDGRVQVTGLPPSITVETDHVGSHDGTEPPGTRSAVAR